VWVCDPVSVGQVPGRQGDWLFAAVKSKAVKMMIGQTYPLADAAEAHRDLEARRTTMFLWNYTNTGPWRPYERRATIAAAL
jgi:hypothetical protein